MKKNIYYFGLFLLLLPFFAQGIEINTDSFVKAEREEEDESFELSAPNMGRVYTKEKVIIKRDLSALDSAMESANEDQKTTPSPLKKKKPSLKKNSNRMPASVTYKDYDVYLGER